MQSSFTVTVPFGALLGPERAAMKNGECKWEPAITGAPEQQEAGN